MIFIGIVIVKVFTMEGAWHAPECRQNPCTATLEYAIKPYTTEKGVYTGEFDSVEACHRASSNNHYVLEPGEDFVQPQFTESLCVPKFSGEGM